MGGHEPQPHPTSPPPSPPPSPLQNIVYYRSTGAFSDAATHYFVMTADADSLNAMGALRSVDTAEADLCSASNVDRDKLAKYVRLAVAEFVPQLAQAELVEGHAVRQALTLKAELVEGHAVRSTSLSIRSVQIS